MSGHIRRRGTRSWELKFEIGTASVTGKRLTRYHSFKGTKREAETELTRLMAGASAGNYVDPSKLTLGDFLDRWLRDWAAVNVSAKTAERYRQLADLHVKPHLGPTLVQKLKPLQVADLYARLLSPKAAGGAGLSARTIGQVHRILHRALGQAVTYGLLQANPIASQKAPRAELREIQILTEAQAREMLKSLRGRSFYMVAALGLATGMRRGEMLALRWRDIDLDAGQLRIERSLEQTRAGLHFKSPKTRHSRRTISLPTWIVDDFRAHQAKQETRRGDLGLGPASADDLVFANWDGTPRNPDALSRNWARVLRQLRLPRVTLHALRHTHASQLIASGMDVLTISRRLGHGSPAITLGVYGHLYADTDDRAARVMDAAFAPSVRQ